MKTKKVKIFLVLFLLLLIGLIVLMNITITSPRIRDMVVARLEKVLGRQVKIGELKINLWRGIQIKELAIENHKDFYPGDFVQAKKLVIRYKLLPLLKRNWVIDRITIINPRILLERDRQGKWNFSDFPAPRDKTVVSRGELSSKTISFLISKITVRGGEINFRDEKISRPLTETGVENLNLVLSGFSLFSPFQFQLTGTLKEKEPTAFTMKGKLNIFQPFKSEVSLRMDNFSLSPYESYLREYAFLKDITGKSNLDLTFLMDKEKNLHLMGRVEGKGIGLEFLPQPATEKLPLERIESVNFSLSLKLTGKVAHSLKITQGEGDLNITKGEVKLSRMESPLDNINGQVKMEGNRISLPGLKANLGDGTIKLRGEAKSSGEDFLNFSQLSYSFQVDFKNLDLGDLRSFTNLHDMLSGKLEGQASLQGKQLSPEAISGQGEIQIREGKLKGIPLVQLLVSLLGMPSLAEIDFQEIYTDFSLENESVRTDNFRLLSRDVDIFAKGAFNFKTNLDYKLAIRLSPEISDKFPLRNVYPRDKEGRTLIETPLTGTFNDPKLDLLKAPVEQIIRKGLEDLLNILGE